MQRILIIVLIVAVILAFMMTYTVRFTETAVLTTLGKAGEGSIQKEPGLKFKWPYPIQQVTKYDTRSRLVETNLETQQTADQQQVVIQAYLLWKVDAEHTLEFYKNFAGNGERADDHYRAAENKLRDNLRSALAQVSGYRLEELLASDSGKSRLPELEAAILATLTESAAAGARSEGEESMEQLSDFGVEAVSVGITAMMMPQDVTRAVFDAMNADRERLAKETTDRGTEQAAAIRVKAKSDAQRIKAFAQRLAGEIESKGNQEASELLKQIQGPPELAVFLANMRFLRESIGRTVTVVLPTDLPGIAAYKPDFVNSIKSGEIPGAGQLNQLTRPIGQSPTTEEGAR